MWTALVRKRERWALTWVGWLLALGLIAVAAVTIARGLGNFLAVSQPVGGQFLVVEAWMPAYAYREAAKEFRRRNYSKLIAVGVLQEDDQADGRLREFVAVGALVRSGIPADRVIEATGSGVQQDRTFHAAMNVKGWLEKQALRSGSVDVLTLGPHARRSRLLYEKALGEGFRVGVISIADRGYDQTHWWRTSEGVRSVIGEAIAYGYARMFFEPSDLGCEEHRC
jgi:hypothetical protein